MLLKKASNKIYFFKKFNFLNENFLKLEFIKLQNINYLFIKNSKNVKKFFKIDSNVKITKPTSTSLFLYSSNSDLLEKTSFFIEDFFDKILEQKKIKQKLVIKGLGYRVSFLADNKSILSFKIGFSHIINLKVNIKKVSVVVKKNSLAIEGFDSNYVGNLCRQIKHLKKKDVYKQKGFLYRYQPLFFKPVKKK